MKALNKGKIKDWFIITRIRILNFIKEHKYISAIVGLLLFSCIIALIVRAATTETISTADALVTGDGRGITVSTETTGEDKTLAPNFSKVTYTLKYYLNYSECGIDDNTIYKSDEVEIVATLPDNVDLEDVKWIGGDETAISNISADGKTLTIKVPQVNMCSEQSQVFTLSILNAQKDTKIKPTITIKGGSNASTVSIENVNEVSTTYDKEYSLTPLVKSGIAKKTSDGNRDVKYGILLGINTDSLSDSISLKGAFLNTSEEITLLATQENDSKSLELYTKNTEIFNQNQNDGNYFGINSSSRYFFSSTEVPDLTSTSGKIDSFIKINSSDASYGVNNDEKTAPIVKLTGSSSVEIEKYPDSSELTYRTANLDDARLTDNENNVYKEYEEKVYKDGEEIQDKEIPLNAVGDYEIHYVITGKNNSTTSIVKSVSIVEPQNTSYSLIGTKSIYVLTGGEYQDKGLYDISTSQKVSEAEYTVKYLENEEEISLEQMLEKPGTYTQEYTITSSDEKIKRTIKIVDELPSITTDKISVKTGNIYEGETFSDHKVIINDEEKQCSKTNDCEYKVGENSNSITYVIEKENYITEITKDINYVPVQYKMSISNINPTSTVKKISDNFYAVGAYYVTAKSIRDSSNSDDIDVKLKAIVDGVESEAVTENKEYANGYDTSSLESTMYVNESSKQVAVTSSSKNGLYGDYFTAAMGEEVTMSSTFKYGTDADDDISELNVKIPVNGNLIPIAYNEEVSSNSYFYLKALYNGSTLDSIPDYTIKYCVSSDECIEPETFDSEKQTIEYIEIVLKPNKEKTFAIKPGTTIELGVKFKVKTYSSTSDVANDLSDLKFNGNITFSWNNNEQDFAKTATTPDVYITPYKARASVSVGYKDNFNSSDLVVLDASKNDNYTVFASTDVVSPAMNITSNIFGYNRIDILPVIFELPSGVNYVYNKDYALQPEVSYQGGKTILTYNYLDVEPNSWLEPIYFDFNVDVSAVTGDFTILVKSGNISSSDYSINNDVSSIDKYKLINKNIRIENTENVSYGQYIYSDGKYISNISKDDSFDFVTKLYNNGEEVTDVSVYTVLPYIDTEKESSFSGSFEIENLPEDAMCTTSDASMVTKAELVDQVVWQSCSDFKDEEGKYSGFSAFKVNYDSISSKSEKQTNIKINTIENNPDDSYVFKSFLQYTNSKGKSSGYISFRDIKLDVISKKITGVVWEDFNVDGIMDDSEKKIENISLKLYNDNDELVQETTPNKEGRYTFTALEEGNYYVVAEFNTEKYGVTGMPSEDFYDKSRLSVFKAVPVEDESEETDETEDEDQVDDDEQQEEGSSSEDETKYIVKTDIITIGSETRIIDNINLGLSLKKVFELDVNKYISKVEVTNSLGVVTTKDYGNTKLAKLDVKDINNLKIKVIYTIEIQNVKYYPGYATLVTELVPDGMSFNPDYEENKGWELQEDGTLINTTLSNVLIEENQKKYLTVAFDITRKEAGSFINYVSIDDLQILGGTEDEQ